MSSVYSCSSDICNQQDQVDLTSGQLSGCTLCQCGVLLERLVRERNCSPKGLGFGRGGLEGSTIPSIHTLEKWNRKRLSGRNAQGA